jgi:GNAT superfamily N-acetyltransferase
MDFRSMLTEQLVIRRAERKDVAGMFALVQELALYEKAPEQVINTPAAMEEDGFGPNAIFKAFVAEDTQTAKLVGMALYYTAYSTWKGKIFFLDDIVVTESMRRHQVGGRLLHALLQEAMNLGIAQIRWQVLDWNTPAIRFYEKAGLEFDPEWINCRMSGAQIRDCVTSKRLIS